MKKIGLFIICLLMANTVYAGGFTDWAHGVADNAVKVIKDGGYDIYVPFYAWHNRLAYDEARQDLLNEPRVAALFCDVNGLKYTNDNFGHKAGDKLIAEFGDILKQFFRHENIYRISGDEFVILFPVTDDVSYRKRVDEFRQMLKSQERPIASMGSSSGEGTKVREIIKDAESKMYEDKKLFHEKFPDYKGR